MDNIEVFTTTKLATMINTKFSVKNAFTKMELSMVIRQPDCGNVKIWVANKTNKAQYYNITEKPLE